MPPRLKNSAQKSAARDVVPVGPRQLFGDSSNKKSTDKVKPSTTKALVLRNGKYGAMGTGELVLTSKLGGREKLDLLSGQSHILSDNRSSDSYATRGLRQKSINCSSKSISTWRLHQDCRISTKRCLCFRDLWSPLNVLTMLRLSVLGRDQ